MPQMVVGEKSNQKFSGRIYQKVFNMNDPFDRLIMELGQKGVLDVCVVGIGGKQTKHQEPGYSRKLTPPKSKHTS
jgi:hypothetical protein